MSDADRKQLLPKKGERDVAAVVCNYLHIHGLDELAADIEARISMGEKKYGRRLETHNGRDARLDLLQEIEDGMMYSAQLFLETQGVFGDDAAFEYQRIFFDLTTIAERVRKMRLR